MVCGRVGNEAAWALEKDAAHHRVGCDRVRHLAADVWAEAHSLAQRGLPDSRRHACAGGLEFSDQFYAIGVA